MQNWHSIKTEDIARAFDSDPEHGLAETDAAARLRQGGNTLPQRPLRSPLQLLAGQFYDPMILVLLVAASIALLMGEVGDSVMIIVIVALNGLLGFVQEFRTEHALAALNKMATPHTRVVRDGHIRQLVATELVVGDLLVLEAGNQVPADARLFHSADLSVQESALTGESDAVEKILGSCCRNPRPWLIARTWCSRALWLPVAVRWPWWWQPAAKQSWAILPVCWPQNPA